MIELDDIIISNVKTKTELAPSDTYRVGVADVSVYLGALLRILETTSNTAQASSLKVTSEKFSSIIKQVASRLPEPLNAVIYLDNSDTKYVHELLLEKYLAEKSKESVIVYYSNLLATNSIYSKENSFRKFSINTVGVREGAIQFLEEVDKAAHAADSVREGHLAEIEESIKTLDGDTGLLLSTSRAFEGKDVASIATALEMMAETDGMLGIGMSEDMQLLDMSDDLDDGMDLGMDYYEPTIFIPEQVTDNIDDDSFDYMDLGGDDWGDIGQAEVSNALEVWSETIAGDRPVSGVYNIDFEGNSCVCASCNEQSFFESPMLLALIDTSMSPIVVAPNPRYACQTCGAILILPAQVLDTFIRNVQQELIIRGVKLSILHEMDKFKDLGHKQMFTEYTIPHVVLTQCFPGEANNLLSMDAISRSDAIIVEDVTDSNINVTGAIISYRTSVLSKPLEISSTVKFGAVACSVCNVDYPLYINSIRSSVLSFLSKMPFVALESIAYKNAGNRASRGESYRELLKTELAQVETFSQILRNNMPYMAASIIVTSNTLLDVSTVSSLYTESQKDLIDDFVSHVLLYQLDLIFFLKSVDTSGTLIDLISNPRACRRLNVMPELYTPSAELRLNYTRMLRCWGDRNMWELARLQIPELKDVLPIDVPTCSYCEFVYGDLFDETLDDEHDELLYGAGKCERLEGESWQEYVTRLSSSEALAMIDSPYVDWFESKEAIVAYADILLYSGSAVYDNRPKFSPETKKKDTLSPSMIAAMCCLLMTRGVLAPNAGYDVMQSLEESTIAINSPLQIYGNSVISFLPWEEFDVGDTSLVVGFPGEYRLTKEAVSKHTEDLIEILTPYFDSQEELEQYMEGVLSYT